MDVKDPNVIEPDHRMMLAQVIAQRNEALNNLAGALAVVAQFRQRIAELEAERPRLHAVGDSP